MIVLSHFITRLSTCMVFALTAMISTTSLNAKDKPNTVHDYYGRWTIDEKSVASSVREKLYQTIDVAPCGSDFCGISVDTTGTCGVTLFRIRYTPPNDGFKGDKLNGSGVWGDKMKYIEVSVYNLPKPKKGRAFWIALGGKHNIASRVDMPTFIGEYSLIGEAKCMVKPSKDNVS